MTRYYFTTEQRSKGGKARAKQAAARHVECPTPQENKVRSVILALIAENQIVSVQFEYPIETKPGLWQYLDICAVLPGGRMIAIEVDGSHGWHDTIKSLSYDKIKAEWLLDHDWPLLVITSPDNAEKVRRRVLEFIGGLQ